MQEPIAIANRLVDNVEKVIVGKRGVIERALVALMCRGHLLFEDVPGVGKTMLARSLSVSIGLQFRRIQFTPDLLPSDVTGVSVYNQKSGEFEFRSGPAITNVLLADEINRATPRTQSALLECMEERQVTIDGESRPLPQPFLVVATQNPIEYEGTFPLPEAQLDRFLMRLSIGYPSPGEEAALLVRLRDRHPIETISQAISSDELAALSTAAGAVYVHDDIRSYIVAIVKGTREHDDVALGASPRGSLALYKTAQALALLRRRSFVLPDDIKELAQSVLAHRLVLRPESQVRGIAASEVVSDILERVPVPVEDFRHA